MRGTSVAPPRGLPTSATAGSASATLPAFTVSTPGKLILMGEHAVVYGRPALVAAIDLRLHARFSSPPVAAPQDPHSAPAAAASPPQGDEPQGDEPEVEIELPGLDHRVIASWRQVLDYAREAREAWEGYAAQPDPARFLALRGDDPAHIVKVALGEAAAAGGERAGGRRGAPPAVRLRLDSELPLGSGFGSSAAAAVAVIGGYLAWRAVAVGPRDIRDPPGTHDTPGRRGAPDSSEWIDTEAVERLALEAERRQHGLPSGVDTATTLHGGLIWAQRLPAGQLGWERLAAASPLLARLGVFHTGTPPEPTGAVVAAVRARRDLDPAGHDRLFDRMATAARAFRAELARAAEDPARVVALIREHQACLEALGVVPGPVGSLVRQVEAAGGAAKVSGAGSLAGPGAGSLLVYHPDPGRLAGWDFLRPFRRYPVHLGAAGFRWETS